MKTQHIVVFILLTVLLLMLQGSVSAQNLEKLNEDNGYRIFQIGSKYDDLKDSLLPLSLNNATTTAYKFIGSDTSFQNIAGVKPFIIHVLFDFSNNLVSISAFLFLTNNGRNFEKRTDELFSKLKKYFLNRYGSNYTTSNFDDDQICSGCSGLIWKTEKVTFTLKIVSEKNMEWRRIDVTYTKTGFFKEGD